MKVIELTATGYYIGDHQCQKCQLTGGWIYPAYYTEILPPETGKFKRVRYSFELNLWIEEDCFIGKILYHKENKSSITIDDDAKSPSDYPDYTDAEIPVPEYAYYYDYSETEWIFNLEKYKADACSRLTALCVNANYAMFPQYKRDNVYSGSPVTDNYPEYLKGDAGKLSIAKLNAVYQQISANAQAAIKSGDVKSRAEIDAIITKIIFPTEAEILAQIQK